MDQKAYDEIALQEDEQWWWSRARQAIAKTLLNRLSLPANAAILDAGCGVGANLSWLAPYGDLHAFEIDNGSREIAAKRGVAKVEAGSLPDQIPFGDKQFDLINLLDVLEHIEDDRATLAALYARLKPGGVLLINVPAFQFLFSHVDVMYHHFRRYGFRELKDKVEAAGFEIELINYWNFLLFPVAALVRFYERLRKKDSSIGFKTPAAPINNTLIAMVSAERFIVPHVRLPFGLSLMVVARKKL